MGEIAILHAADARAFACRLSSELAAEGHSVLRREGEAPGAGVDPATKAEAVVVVWSPGMLKNAPMIEAARRALARRALAPVRIGGVEPPASFAHLWPIDLDGWNGETDDPRWQFVRDEIALAMRRSEIALSTAQIVRPPAIRRLAPKLAAPQWRRAGASIGKAPIRLLAPGALSLALIASVAVIVSAQQSHSNAANSASPPMVAFVEPVRAAPADAAIERPIEIPAPPLRVADLAGIGPPVSGGSPDEGQIVADVFGDELGETFADESGAPAPRAAIGGPDTSAVETAPAAAPTIAAPQGDPPAEASAVAAAESAPAATPAYPLPPGDDFAGVVFRDCYDCPDMTHVPAANVALSRREVTFDQWAACVRDKACRPVADDGLGRGSRPVVNVSWEDARAYAQWLTAKTGWTYRLPTEAEWTRAAAAEKAALSPASANYAGAAWNAALPAGSFKASEYGLYDMRGNVWEWTADCALAEGEACRARILKGGAYDAPASALSAEANWRRGETARALNIGLRVARESS